LFVDILGGLSVFARENASRRVREDCKGENTMKRLATKLDFLPCPPLKIRYNSTEINLNENFCIY
ncbi:MAG: hypothetical protein K9N48_01880, partial [Verrucomicrobia bacterium]|nr:hypothetical protein [Verrucomicrobiota bacterium]